MARLFGTDGIRGIANTELTPELAVGLGRAVVRTLRERGISRPNVLVGRDPRASGEMLEAALVAGLCSAGGDVAPLGVLPTPAVAYLVPRLGADAGAVISASHNPVDDNGIKFFGADGFKLTDEQEDRVEELMQVTAEDRPTGAAIGRVRAAPEAVDAYADHLFAAADADLTGLRLVVDCANGAAARVAPEMLRRLGCDVAAINASPDGANINAACGSTHPEVVATAVVEQHADIGLAFDGDADRLIAADHTGAIVDGDAILAVLAASLREQRPLDAVVTTVMSNLGFRRAMHELGLEIVETKVGDRYVLEAMRAGSHPIGGEPSGHIILADHATTGDGLLTAVRLLSVVAGSGRPLADLASRMQRLPQVLRNIRGVDRERLVDAAPLWEAVAAEEATLGEHGRVLVRASGTEPLVRVMVEAESEQQAEAAAERLAAAVTEHLVP